MTYLKAYGLIFLGMLLLQSQISYGEEIYSLTPNHKCKRPPSSPPKSMLEKEYRTYITVGNWHIFDINGDGWCDWIRNGRQGHRSDIDSVPMIEMIYLGTSTGWRRFETKVNRHVAVSEFDGIDKIHLPGFAEAFGFYQPIPIYKAHSRKPYVVAASRIDAPAPFPNMDSINVFEWDKDTDNLRYIDGNVRGEIIRFLSEKYCSSRKVPLYDGEEMIMTFGDLCGRLN